MKLICRLLGAVLALALVATAGAWMLHQTVGDEHYLVQKTQEAHTADQVAAQLPVLLGSFTPTPADTQTILQDAITPSFARDQIETLLPQLVKYYTAGGEVPQLDLRDLDQRVAATGFVVPASLATIIENPQPVTAGRLDAPLMTAAHESQQLLWVAPLAALVLIGLIVVLGKGRRWTVLAGASLSAAFSTAALAAVVYLPPTLIASTLNTSSAKPLAPAVRSLADAVARDQSHRLLWMAGGLAGAALVCGLIQVFIRMQHTFSRSKKEHT